MRGFKRLFIKRCVMGCIIFVSFVGCAAVTGHQDGIAAYSKKFADGVCDVTEQKNKIAKSDDAVLSANQAGALLRQCGDFNASVYYFDVAESKYKEDIDEKGALSAVGAEIGSALVNENTLDYEGYYYERVMTNIYKSLDFMSMKDYDSARVELNRAIDRQRRAKDMYAQQLQKAKDELEKDAKVEQKDQKSQNDSQISAILSSYESSIGDFRALPNFINPFTSYLAGIFFFMDGNYEKSRDLLKETLLMDSKNPQVRKDMALIDSYFSKKGHKNLSKYVWVIYENGQTIARKELRYDIPLFIATMHVPHVGIALPTLDQSASSYEFIKVNGEPTIQIADMDAVVRTEFKDQMPVRVTRTVARAITKAALSYGAREAAGDIGTIAAGLYSAITNKSDVRYWSTLPRDFQSLRVENKGQILQIVTNDAKPVKNITLKEGLNAIIYIKSLTPGNISLNEIYYERK